MKVQYLLEGRGSTIKPFILFYITALNIFKVHHVSSCFIEVSLYGSLLHIPTLPTLSEPALRPTVWVAFPLSRRATL